MPLMRKEMRGRKFYRLRALSFHHNVNGSAHWLFLCDCGKKKVLRGYSVRVGRVKSCGCLHSELARQRQHDLCYKHGKSGSRIFVAHRNMMRRCYNVKSEFYSDYGGRGIAVCKRWHKFENFYADMGDATDGMTLDRIDNNSGYSRVNCRWATKKQQANNRRSTRLITRNGQTKSLKEWCTSLPYKLVHQRMRKGWDIEKALSTPHR